MKNHFPGCDQVELRINAHFSKEPVLVDAFKNGHDVHTRTAMRLFGKSSLEEVRFCVCFWTACLCVFLDCLLLPGWQELGLYRGCAVISMVARDLDGGWF